MYCTVRVIKAKVGQMLTGQMLTNDVGEWTNAHQEKKY